MANSHQLVCPRCRGPMYDLDGPDPGSDEPVCIMDERHYRCLLCTCNPEDQYTCYTYPRVVHDANSTPRQRADAALDCVERSRRIREIAINADIRTEQRMNWISDAARVARAVSEGNTDLAPVFWIRLYGILHEIYDSVRELHDAALDFGARPDVRAVTLLDEIKRLASLFSDDELLYIQYRRDVECHPVQNAYELRFDKKGDAVESVNQKLLSTQTRVSLDDFRNSVRKVLATVRYEVALAQPFAHRCWQALHATATRGSLQLYR